MGIKRFAVRVAAAHSVFIKQVVSGNNKFNLPDLFCISRL